MFSLFFLLIDALKSPSPRRELAVSAHDRFLSQATSHAHLEHLEREWDRRSYEYGVD